MNRTITVLLILGGFVFLLAETNIRIAMSVLAFTVAIITAQEDSITMMLTKAGILTKDSEN